MLITSSPSMTVSVMPQGIRHYDLLPTLCDLTRASSTRSHATVARSSLWLCREPARKRPVRPPSAFDMLSKASNSPPQLTAEYPLPSVSASPARRPRRPRLTFCSRLPTPPYMKPSARDGTRSRWPGPPPLLDLGFLERDVLPHDRVVLVELELRRLRPGVLLRDVKKSGIRGGHQLDLNGV